MLRTLCKVIGTTEDECRLLLIEIGERGVQLARGEGWAMISRTPVDRQ
jgi:hypothetical protein